MGLRRAQNQSSWPELCEAVDVSALAPSSRASPILRSNRTDVDTMKEKARIEQELENDRRFFADPPDDFVRCPNCHVIYAVNTSRATTPDVPSGRTAPPVLIPASYSKDLPRGANLSLEEATRHMHRSRFRCSQCAGGSDFCRCGVSPYHWGWSCDGWQKHEQIHSQACPVGSCRWCSQPCMAKMRRSESLCSPCCGSDEGTDLKRFPPSLSCAEKERTACGKRHSDCGHWCGGVRGEQKCLPCLRPECKASKRRSVLAICDSTGSQALVPLIKIPDGDEWCPICWTEPLNGAPTILLNCGHAMHRHCAEAMVRKGHAGGCRLTFKSIRCPLCKEIMGHPGIDDIVAPLYKMYQKVRQKAMQRWVVEQRSPLPCPNDAGDEDRIATLAMSKMTFFECSQCNEPYYGGEVECGAEVAEEDDLDDDVQAALAMELVCRGCASKGQVQCPEHGTEFLGWKCRYCCEREAHYFCFGTTHFCHVCHDLWQTGVEQRRKLQAGKPCLGKDRCIFGGRHPPGCRNGRDEYALGCTICAQDAEHGILVNKKERVTRRRFGNGENCSLM